MIKIDNNKNNNRRPRRHTERETWLVQATSQAACGSSVAGPCFCLPTKPGSHGDDLSCPAPSKFRAQAQILPIKREIEISMNRYVIDRRRRSWPALGLLIASQSVMQYTSNKAVCHLGPSMLASQAKEVAERYLPGYLGRVLSFPKQLLVVYTTLATALVFPVRGEVPTFSFYNGSADVSSGWQVSHFDHS